MANVRSKTEQTQDYSVDIFELSKEFSKTKTRAGYSTLKSLILSPFRKKSEEPGEKITAIKDLTVRIPQGASVGIVGRNGAGKSTLLKLITGIYQPDNGYVKTKGRIAALIELGAGFHPDFTGRENLYLGGVLHGLTKSEITKKLPEIIRFAELEDFIDQPVRTYSSGMFMRLGFSLAVNTDPDILLIDEVLAVGDARFITKCQDKIADLRRQGKTLFLVSHDLTAIERWSDEAIWIEKGKVRDRGEPRRVIDHYLEFVEKGDEETLKKEAAEQGIKGAREVEAPVSALNDGVADSIKKSSEKMEYQRWGGREITIEDIKLMNSTGDEHLLFHTSEPAIIQIKYKLNDEFKDPVFGFGINRADGACIIGTNTNIENVSLDHLSDAGYIKIFIPAMNLLQGTYYLDVATHREDGYAYDYHKNVIKFSVRSDIAMAGAIDLRHSWTFDSVE